MSLLGPVFSGSQSLLRTTLVCEFSLVVLRHFRPVHFRHSEKVHRWAEACFFFFSGPKDTEWSEWEVVLFLLFLQVAHETHFHFQQGTRVEEEVEEVEYGMQDVQGSNKGNKVTPTQWGFLRKFQQTPGTDPKIQICTGSLWVWGMFRRSVGVFSEGHNLVVQKTNPKYLQCHGH